MMFIGKISRRSGFWVPVLALLVMSGSVAGAYGMRSLDGQWQFKMDPENKGESQQWFSASAKFDKTISVPGCWDAQGFGPASPKVHHNYIGKAWYKKTVPSPPLKEGEKLFLCIERVHRYAKVWVNGRFLTEHIGYLSPIKCDITEIAQKGNSLDIVIQIDSRQRWDVDTLMGCSDLIDYMWTPWGGISGHVTLEKRQKAWLEDVFVYSQVNPVRCNLLAVIKGAPESVSKLRVELTDKNGNSALDKTFDHNQEDNQSINLTFDVENAHLWSTDDPFLYTLKCSIYNSDECLDSREFKFGIRQIEIKGNALLLNGKKVFLRGYGDDSVYPETIMPPTDRNTYLERLKQAKKFGFNHVRHHSHFLPDEYYQACDEVGILVSPELSIGYKVFYDKAKGKAIQTYRDEWISAIKQFRNHPSIMIWSLGNEMWNAVEIADEFYKIAKDLDPSRPVVDSDGLLAEDYKTYPRSGDRDTLDLYYLMFNVWSHPLDNPDKFILKDPLKPVIAHELGNYVTFPRMDLIEEFKHNIKPFWLTPVKEKLIKLGLLAEADQWAFNSEKLYHLLHKINVEELRKNPLIQGYHWWLFQDYWTTSNGLVDMNYREKSIQSEDVLTFNNDIVLLVDGLDLTYTSGQTLNLNFLISNFSASNISDVRLHYTIKTDKEIIKEGSIAVDTTDVLTDLDKVSFKCPDVKTPEKLFFKVKMNSGGKEYTNQWDTRLFPNDITITNPKVPVYASSDLLEIELLKDINVKPLNGKSTGLPAVYIAHQPTPWLLEQVQKGGFLILLSPADVFACGGTRFKQAWWSGVLPGDRNAGTVIYDSPVTKDFLSESWCDQSWFSLIDGCQKFIMDDFKNKPDNIIRALDVHFLLAENWDKMFEDGFGRSVEPEFLFRDNSLLFQGKVEKGGLIVSGLNLNKNTINSKPEAKWLFKRIVEYACTLPNIKNELDVAALKSLAKKADYLNGPRLSGFGKILKHDGSERLSSYYRLRYPKMYCVEQKKNDESMTWQSSPVPSDIDNDRLIFVFKGGFGCGYPPPKKEMPGFTLFVNGKEAFEFGVVSEQTKWQTKDGKVQMLFVPAKFSWTEAVGDFYLSIDKSRCGQDTMIFKAVASGKEKDHWFGIHKFDGKSL